jgi:hypothetical protein
MLDQIIILLAIAFALIFLLLSISRIFTVYLWIVLWFFIYLSINTQLKYLSLLDLDNLTNIQKFFLDEKTAILTISVFLIPILAIILSLFTCVCKKSKYLSLLFGFALPFVFLSFVVYINENSFVKLDFLNDLSNFFLDSKFYDFFYFHPNYIFYILWFLIFIKAFYYIILILYHFIIWLVSNIRQWLLNREEEKNSR